VFGGFAASAWPFVRRTGETLLTLAEAGVLSWANGPRLSRRASDAFAVSNPAGTTGATLAFDALGRVDVFGLDGMADGTLAAAILEAVYELRALQVLRVGTTAIQSPLPGDLLASSADATMARTLAEGLVATVEGVALNSAAKQPLLTLVAARKFQPTRFIVRHASGTPTTATCTFGWNANANDLAGDGAAPLNLTQMTTALHSIATQPWGANTRVGATDDVLGVKMVAVEGTAKTVTIDVFGYYPPDPAL